MYVLTLKDGGSPYKPYMGLKKPPLGERIWVVDVVSLRRTQREGARSV